LARLEKSALSQKQPILLISAFDEILQRYRLDIKQKNLKVKIADTGNLEIVTDKYYLDLIFDNIISNAIKYSFPNTTLLISIDKNKDGVFCKIGDEGIGIRQEDLSRIFRPFFRSEAL